MMIAKINIQGKDYPLEITKKRIKRIYLRVNHGAICVSSPYGVNREEIERFIHQSEDWIIHQFDKEDKENTNQTEVTFFGKTYPIVQVESNVEHMEIVGDRAVFYGMNLSEERKQQLLYSYGSKVLVKKIQELRKQWDTLICVANNKPKPKITIKYMKTRWGSCTPARNSISMNVRLIHYPDGCLEYVLLHEYVHILVPNHSKAFYAMVESYMPEWEYYKNLMR